jgi:hypothetical protein
VSDTFVLQIVIITVLVVACVAIGLLAWRGLARRRDQLRLEIDASKASVEERAFNRIHIGQSAADHLERSGVDVSGPRRLLDQASRSYDAGKHDDALALASSAHEAMLKQTSPSPPSPPAAPPPVLSSRAAATGPAVSSPPPGIVPGMAPAPASDPSSSEVPPAMPGRLPKNKAESHFQLRLLDEELDAGGPPGTAASTISGVRVLANDAHATYDRGDYTEALRLALKGRRNLGARLETLPPPSAAPSTDAPADSAPGSGDRCHQCGAPLRAGDKFCRGCGAAGGTGTCARCGDSLDPADQFCGRCGTPRPQ